MLTLHGIAGLIGEALVPELVLRALHHVAAGLPGVEVLATATDELGRTGLGISRVERGKRVEPRVQLGPGNSTGIHSAPSGGTPTKTPRP
jgi:hypothetical protein